MSQQYYPLGMSIGGGGGAPATFTASVTPNDLYYSSLVAGTTLTSASVTVTPTGGTPAYTYAWATNNNVTANSATSATTTFSDTGRGSYSDDVGIMVCTVTDNAGLKAYATVRCEFAIGVPPPPPPPPTGHHFPPPLPT